jgi:hypothetical protein
MGGNFLTWQQGFPSKKCTKNDAFVTRNVPFCAKKSPNERSVRLVGATNIVLREELATHSYHKHGIDPSLKCDTSEE